MGDAFVPLETLLRTTIASLPDSPATRAVDDADAPDRACRCDGEFAAVRRFRAALADALETALDILLRDIACDVLARELALAPADLAAIATAALERYGAEAPLRVRAHPDDVAALEGVAVSVAADAGLRRGDLAIDLRTGTIDASLGARLACALARMR